MSLKTVKWEDASVLKKRREEEELAKKYKDQFGQDDEEAPRKLNIRSSKVVQINQRVTDGWEVKKYSTQKIIIKNQPDKEGWLWVYVFVDATYFERKKDIRWRKKFNTGVKVLPKEWDEDRQEIKSSGKIPHAFERNTTINELYNKINTSITKLQRGEYVELDKDLELLKEVFGQGIKKVKAKGKALTDYIEEYTNYRIKKGTHRGTYKVFITLRNRIEAYEEANDDVIYLQDINLSLSDKLIQFWSKSLNPNTIGKTFEVLVTILNYYYARRDELHIPLTDKFQMKEFGKVMEYEQPPIALTDSEIEAIRKFDFEAYREKQMTLLDKQIKKNNIEFKRKFLVKGINNKVESMILTRDRSLLQIACGLRVSDLFSLKKIHIDTKKNIIKVNPIKTMGTKATNQTIIPLFPMAKEILEKHGYDTTKKPFKVSDQVYNRSIKDLMEAVGIKDEIEIIEFKGMKPVSVTKLKWEVITSHNFRDTFITVAIRNKVPIPIILKWTNQSSYAVMKKYIALTEQDITTDVVMFE